MDVDPSILRLILSHSFIIILLLMVIPLKQPFKRSLLWLGLGALLITLFNVFFIINLGIEFYIRYYFITLLLPYITVLSLLAINKWNKLFFAILSIQMIANFAIINGLLASYLFYGEDTPLIDTLARLITYLLFLPIVIKFIRPLYATMVNTLIKGWWVLNAALIIAYVQAYFIAFVPNAIFHRPEYFVHAYISILFTIIMYIIMYFLFREFQLKSKIEFDKDQLSMELSSLTKKTDAMSSIAYIDALTGIKNRYSLFEQMNQAITNGQTFLVVFMDLDNLKAINDTFGHLQGDAYIKNFALAVQKTISPRGTVYRYAGDEFVGLITENCDTFDVKAFKTTVAQSMTMTLPYYGFSIGLACYPENGNNPGTLISIADQAMYVEKKTKMTRR